MLESFIVSYERQSLNKTVSSYLNSLSMISKNIHLSVEIQINHFEFIIKVSIYFYVAKDQDFLVGISI
jgi:uncharacterized protein YpmS